MKQSEQASKQRVACASERLVFAVCFDADLQEEEEEEDRIASENATVSFFFHMKMRHRVY